MKELTTEQVEVLNAFLECFDLHTTGVWKIIATAMEEEYGIENPEDAMEEVREALR